MTIYSGDETYGDEITSGLLDEDERDTFADELDELDDYYGDGTAWPDVQVNELRTGPELTLEQRLRRNRRAATRVLVERGEFFSTDDVEDLATGQAGMADTEQAYFDEQLRKEE